MICENSLYLCTSEEKFEKIYETANPFNCVAHWGVV